MAEEPAYEEEEAKVPQSLDNDIQEQIQELKREMKQEVAKLEERISGIEKRGPMEGGANGTSGSALDEPATTGNEVVDEMAKKTMAKVQRTMSISDDSCLGRFLKENEKEKTKPREFGESTHQFLIYCGVDKDINSLILGGAMWVVQMILYSILWNEANQKITEDEVEVGIARLDCKKLTDGTIESVTEDDVLKCPSGEDLNYYYSILPITLLSIYVQPDFVACLSLIFSKKSTLKKLMAFVVMGESGFALVTGLLWCWQGINKGSGYDAIVNSIGVLFIHDLDEQLYSSVEKLNESKLTTAFQKCCSLCPCCQNFGALFCTLVFIGFVFLLSLAVNTLAYLDVEGAGLFSAAVASGECQVLTYKGAQIPVEVCWGFANSTHNASYALQYKEPNAFKNTYTGYYCEGDVVSSETLEDANVQTLSTCTYVLHADYPTGGGCKNGRFPFSGTGFAANTTWSSKPYIEDTCAPNGASASYEWSCNKDGTVATRKSYANAYCSGNPVETTYTADGSNQCEAAKGIGGTASGKGTATLCFVDYFVESGATSSYAEAADASGACTPVWIAQAYETNDANAIMLEDGLGSREECLEQAYQSGCQIAFYAQYSFSDGYYTDAEKFCECRYGTDKTPADATYDPFAGYTGYTYSFSAEGCFLEDDCTGYTSTPFTGGCQNHDDCTSASRPFCIDAGGYGECVPCEDCHVCSQGIDGTCGTQYNGCPPLYPNDEPGSTGLDGFCLPKATTAPSAPTANVTGGSAAPTQSPVSGGGVTGSPSASPTQ